jgi:hypothetical protein
MRPKRCNFFAMAGHGPLCGERWRRAKDATAEPQESHTGSRRIQSADRGWTSILLFTPTPKFRALD